MNFNKLSKSFMAISKGKESTEGATFKRYTGVAACTIVAINPSRTEMNTLFNSDSDKDVEYVGTTENNEGKTIQTARVTFIVKPDEAKYGNVGLFSHTFFLRREYRFNRDKTKVQVIDKYGRTAWVTIEQAKAHEIPMYANGPANLDKDYRPAFVGEEDLTNFISTFLNIPSPMKYNSAEKKWYMVEHPEESECRLDHIDSYFKNDFSEIKDAIALQPNNKVKILFGVRTAEDGKQFQVTFTRMALRNNVSDYSKLDAEVMEMKNNSTSASVANTTYDVVDLHEYVVEATTFTDTEAEVPAAIADDPFSFD